MKRIRLAVAGAICLLQMSTAAASLTLSADGLTVFDSANGVTWLADANLASHMRFGLPLCTASTAKPCVNTSGSMDYQSAAAWVNAMNAAAFLGQDNWQLPTTPLVDKSCGRTGPNGGSFGFGCSVSALASLYNALGFLPPNPAAAVPDQTVGPFSNIQPYLYWTQTPGSGGNVTFSFATGWQGSNTLPNFLYVWPMVPGKLPGAAPVNGSGLQPASDGQTVYDPETDITWLANANLAAGTTFGIPRCTDPLTPPICVAADGSMTWASAVQFIADMNSAAYLGQRNWQISNGEPACPGYGCAGNRNPLGNLFYNQLDIGAGASAVPLRDAAAGPFHDVQPYLYWSCQGAAVQGACGDAGPVPNQQWSFSFGSGFQGTDLLANDLFVTAYFAGTRAATIAPTITLVANAEGESAVIAPNTWVEIKGANLAPAGDTRVWQGSDFKNGQMPAALDGVSVTVNGKNAYVYYISPVQINILTPPDAMTGPVSVVVTRNGESSAPFSVQAQPLSPSFFVFYGGPYVAATHVDGSLVGPPSLYPGLTTPAKPGDVISLYANGFGPTTQAIVSGASTQGGTLSPLPVIAIGGAQAVVQYAGLISPGLFQFNVVIPQNAASGDNSLVATINGVQAAPNALITIRGQAALPSTETLYVAPDGNDRWSGLLPAPNSTNTDGPFASFDRARSVVQTVLRGGLSQIDVQFRGGTYYLPATEILTPADSGTANTEVVYENYPNETPIISGGVRVTNWTNVSGNVWKASLPASTAYFETMFYNGTRRQRPRLGGYLGTFYRVASTVYLQNPGPPAQAPDPNCPVYIGGSGWECFDRFQYNPADPISAAWKNLAPAAGNRCNQPAGNAALAADIQILIFEQFSTSILPVSCVDASNHIVYTTGPTGISQTNASEEGFITGNRYLVENVQDQLTAAGQWFLDRSTTPWTLTYLANPGENPNMDTVVIAQQPLVLAATGVQYITLRGLTFEHDNYTIPLLGHRSRELEADVSAAVSFQNSQHITIDGITVTQTSGTGLEFISCINSASPQYCLTANPNAVSSNNVIQNSAVYDTGALGIRIGSPYLPEDTDANTVQAFTVQNNVVEGYGRTIPASFGIGQGEGHNNLYTHNDVYDGYHCAISISEQAGDMTQPNTIGNANNTISFNHVYNLLQGIMNDGGSIRIEAGNHVYTAPGNKILNNKIHDVTDASIMDPNGYGGNGIYMDNSTGLVDVENNLVYRVSANSVYTPRGPAAPNQANIIRNNILAYGRQGIIATTSPFFYGVPPVIPEVFAVSNNLIYFDRGTTSSPKFFVQGGCIYAGGAPFKQFQEFDHNLYWRTDGGFAAETKAFAVQPSAATGPNAPCSGNTTLWTFYTFSAWQQQVGEDAGSVVQNPGFANAAYPADDYSLPRGSPIPGFVVFDPNQAGRTNPVIKPPPVAPGFVTKLYNPATDY